MAIDTEKLLEMNEKRFISQITKIGCAICGSEFKVYNRDPIPFEFETLNESIGKIFMTCPVCGAKYDLGICTHH